MIPIVTQHAMVRYLERKHGRNIKALCRAAFKAGDAAVLKQMVAVHGLDIAALKAEILTPPVLAAMAAGAKAIRHDGVRFVFQNHCVVTVTPSAMPTPRARRA
jgi:hypothetical protein